MESALEAARTLHTIYVAERDQAREAAGRYQALAAEHLASANNLAELISAMEKHHPELKTMVPSTAPAPIETNDAPRGREAVERILTENRGKWMTVGDVVNAMNAHGWRDPRDPRDNTVRNALARAVDAGVAERRHEHGYGSLVFRIADPEAADDNEVNHLQAI